MKAFIIYNETDSIKNKSYIESYIEEGKLLHIDIRLLILENLSFGVENNKWYIKENNTKLEMPDFVICRTIHPLLSSQLEYMGVKVFNNSFVSRICNDKAKTYQYVATTGIDIVDSEFVKNELAYMKTRNVSAPMVMKTVDGHGGKEVYLIPDELSSFQEKADVVIQPLIGQRKQDLRVYVIGKSIIAAVLRTAKEGFRANFSLGGEVRLYDLNDKEITIVNKIIDLFDFGLVGIDFIIGDQGELIFNEIEDVVGARMLYQCSDINLVKLYLEYIIRNL